MNSGYSLPEFDIQEFHQRWLKARIAAFPEPDPAHGLSTEDQRNETKRVNLFFAPNPSGAENTQSGGLESDEPDKSKDKLLRTIFDHSRKLGLSLSKQLGITFEIQDFETLLKTSSIPCVQGTWTARKNARVLDRKGCSFCLESKSNSCDYWREALDGLVMGLGEKERLARHASVRHGDATCTDVFFIESNQNEDENQAWGPLPEHMALELYEIAALFHHTTGIQVVIKGFREGVLFFEFSTSTDLLCGNTNLLGMKFQGLIREKYPGLALKDVTPQAVLGTTAS